MDAKTTKTIVCTLPDHVQDELFELTTDLLVVLDATGLVVWANAAFSNLLGYSLHEITGNYLVTFVHADDQVCLAVALEQLSSGSVSEQTVLQFLTKINPPIRCDFTLHLSSNGPYILASGRNLDAWYQNCNCICKEAEELEHLINERTHDLQLANAEMESFSLSISHDLRAPLRAIRGFTKAIGEEHGDELGETGRDYVQRILSNCERMTTLTDYLLQLARMSRQELHFTTVDLGQMAETIVANMHAAEPERIVTFSHQGAMVVDGDRDLLFTLLQNLLDNAWKYTARRARADIVFSSREGDGETIFTVADNGVGYPVVLQDRLFFLFQRLHDPQEYEGMGVGLPTAQRIVQRHGGRIWGECIEGEGAAFHFTLKGRPS
jgi:signal transduction histidine kinase